MAAITNNNKNSYKNDYSKNVSMSKSTKTKSKSQLKQKSGKKTIMAIHKIAIGNRDPQKATDYVNSFRSIINMGKHNPKIIDFYVPSASPYNTGGYIGTDTINC